MIRRGAFPFLALWLITACAGGAPPPATPAPSPVPAPPVPEAPPVVVAEPEVLPEPALPEPAPKVASITLAFTGDINLGTVTLPGGIPPDSGRGVLRAAAPHLAGDLVVGNLEGVFADTGVSEKCIRRRGGRTEERPNCYAFRTPTWLAPRLADAGFTHVNLANNHSGDLGAAGRATTLETVRSLGLVPYGLIGSIAIDTLTRGDSTSTVALVGFATYPFAYNLLELDRSRAVIDSVQQLADVVIVTFHGGDEGADALHVPEGPEFLGSEPRGELRRWARVVLDAGADAVIGHGPHVLRGIEFHEGKPIAYSLGNFATYRGFSVSGALGITGVLSLELAGNGTFLSARFVPMHQAPRRGPAPDPARRAIELLRRLSAEDFGPRAARILDDGTVLPPASASD